MTTANEFNTQFQSLQARATACEKRLEQAIPVTDLGSESQEAFLFCLSDVKTLEHLLNEAKENINILLIAEHSTASQGDNQDEDLIGLLSQLLEKVSDRFGVNKELLLPATEKYTVWQLELIEQILKKCEDNAVKIA